MIPSGTENTAAFDPSEVMFSQAKKRNAAVIRERKVEPIFATAERMPMFDTPFDKIFSINLSIFWKNPITQLKELRSRMAPGGIIAITLQPHSKGVNDETAYKEGKKILHYLEEAGFSQIRMEKMEAKPVFAICVIGK